MLLVVVTLLLVGHQHYFLDIAVAPFFGYTSFRVSVQINQKIISLSAKNHRDEAAPGSTDVTIIN